MAGRGGGSNTTHTLLSPDPETLPIGECVPPNHRRVSGNQDAPRPTNIGSLCSLNGRSQLPLSRKERPAIIPYELVAENGLFQPSLMLARKTPKLTPRPDQPEVETRQLTLCPSSTNSLEPSLNLASSQFFSIGGPRFRHVG